MKKPEVIKLSDLEATTGGLRWEGRRESYYLEDRRFGAPVVVQRAVTWWHNFRNGYWY